MLPEYTDQFEKLDFAENSNILYFYRLKDLYERF